MNRKLILSLIAPALLAFTFAARATTLSEAVTSTIHTNPDILIKLKGWLAAKEGVSEAQGGYLPAVNAEANFGQERTKNSSTDFDYSSLTTHGIGIELRQMLFDGFFTPSEVQRNKYLTLAEQYQTEGIANTTALLAAKAYLDVMRTKEIVGLALQNYQSHQKIYTMIKHRGETGLGRQADTDQAYGRLALAKSNLLSAQNQAVDAETTYNRVVGTEADNLITPPDPVNSLLPMNETNAIELALENYPLLKSAVADIAEAKAQYNTAKSPYYPRLDAVLSAGQDRNINGIKGTSEDYRAMLELKYNLFRGGSDRARQLKTAFLFEQAEEIHARTYREVIENMRLAWSSLQTANAQLIYLQQHKDAAQSTANSYLKQFQIGKRTLLDLLNSENELFTARTDYVNGRMNVILSKYRVLEADGELLSFLGVTVPMDPNAKPILTHPQGAVNYRVTAVKQPVAAPTKIAIKPITTKTPIPATTQATIPSKPETTTPVVTQATTETPVPVATKPTIITKPITTAPIISKPVITTAEKIATPTTAKPSFTIEPVTTPETTHAPTFTIKPVAPEPTPKPGFTILPVKTLPTKTEPTPSAQPETNAATTNYSVTDKRLSTAVINNYTLQLYSSFDKQDAINFIMNNKLQENAAFYQTKYLDKDKYVVVYGHYQSDQLALDAIKTLPPTIQQFNPIIKPFADVQKEMQGQ